MAHGGCVSCVTCGGYAPAAENFKPKSDTLSCVCLFAKFKNFIELTNFQTHTGASYFQSLSVDMQGSGWQEVCID